jgi:hypothetical protein
MATIRAQIERDERELAQLGQCQEEARQLREHNQNEGRQLRQLEAEYQNGETQLRRTVQMVGFGSVLILNLSRSLFYISTQFHCLFHTSGRFSAIST